MPEELDLHRKDVRKYSVPSFTLSASLFHVIKKSYWKCEQSLIYIGKYSYIFCSMIYTIGISFSWNTQELLENLTELHLHRKVFAQIWFYHLQYRHKFFMEYIRAARNANRA